ncbi:MAG: hypothetical protein F6K54_14310 [Okeania sp. SIO3B5]|uniref:SAV_2336 N-terminal domain-related protein n=1 Tax=Okeania sp. SIO3B5 TaxID=2607811 RepID=UPI0013FEDE21|nr:SAV_2336 N-terminal domain-related protein [Okeania sp. SIO3B5]NEO54148.1 hypothetical protein [Okeania sp. SIO3B5]
MIDELITALSKKAGMSTEEIADTIWLALQIQESQSESVSPDFSLVEEDIGANKNKTTSSDSKPQTPDSNETRKNRDSQSQKAKIYPQSQQQTESLDLSFKTPNAPSLRQPLTLARALKPLMRRIPAGTNFVVDEAATIEHIANTKLWLPVLRPTLEPWLDLELVVDESISMQIWRQTIRDLEKLLKNYGIFRDVRVWGMTANDGEKVQVRRGIGAAAKNKFPRSSKELIDGSGRRLILVVSDCVSSYWRDGTVTEALEIWANSVPTAIIQMLPKWLWKRTALGRASEVRLRGLTPGVSNQNLIAQEVSLWEELEEKKGVKVPIFTLEEDKATTWAQMLSGKSSVSTLGFVFKLDAPVKENRLFNLDYSQLSAEERVQAFRVTASPMARKLAGLLAAVPITLPVVRLIRGALLPESLQVNVAEVFLGGLLKPLSEIKVETNPDDVVYGFVDGVRELLIDSMPSEWVLQVVDKVSEYVAERVGLSLEDFAAVLRREKEVEDSGVVEEVGYFATVTAQVLRRLGGEYVEVVEELEYTQLRKLLIAQNWKEADKETARLILQVSGQEERGWLTKEDMQKFPSTDLKIIDELWFKHSNGKFGFSVQKQIWLMLGGQIGYNDHDVYNKFGENVGWYVKDKNEWLLWREHTFSLNAPQGHLPRYLPSRAQRIRPYLFYRKDLKDRSKNIIPQEIISLTENYYTQSSGVGFVDRLAKQVINFSQKNIVRYGLKLAFSQNPNQEYFISGGNQIIKSWQREKNTWQIRQEITLEDTFDTWFTSVAISPDGQLIAACKDYQVKIWRLDQINPLHTLNKTILSNFFDFEGFDSVTFSPDGKILAANNNQDIKLWDVETGKEIIKLSGHSDKVTCIAFNPKNGKILASCSYDKTIKVWNIVDKRCLGTLSGHLGAVYTLGFSPDGETLASGGNDNTIKLWNLNPEGILETLQHSEAITCLVFTPDGKTLVSGSNDGKIVDWKIYEKESQPFPQEHHRGVTSIAISPDGKTLISGGRDQTIKIWRR